MTSKAVAIARTTFRESIRSKILYTILLFAVVLVAISAFFGTVTIGDQEKIIKDFGLLSISLFSVAFVVISGAALLHKELAGKTIYNILAKPVTRTEFVAGKYMGILVTTLVLIMAMGAGLSAFCCLLERRLDPTLCQAYFYLALQAAIVCAAALFFSSLVVTPLLSGLFTFALFLAGRSSEYILYFAAEGSSAFARGLASTIYWMIPHLDLLTTSDAVVYGRTMSVSHMAWSTLYAAGYSAILLLLGSIVFRRREFN